MFSRGLGYFPLYSTIFPFPPFYTTMLQTTTPVSPKLSPDQPIKIKKPQLAAQGMARDSYAPRLRLVRLESLRQLEPQSPFRHSGVPLPVVTVKKILNSLRIQACVRTASVPGHSFRSLNALVISGRLTKIWTETS